MRNQHCLGWKQTLHQKIISPARFHAILLILFSFLSLGAFAQTRTLTGTVRNTNNEPLAGITLGVKGTRTITATNESGRFSITTNRANPTLVFSGVGVKETEIPVGDKNDIDVSLETTSSELEKVVVVAYGTQRKETLSGAVASVKGDEILKSPAINVSNSLAGRVPGLTVVGQSGEPGNDFSTILIRGVNTFRNSSPLFVVDGIPLPKSDKLQKIDPSVIESITVMKDASAAIYGAEAANGVILITTKRGKAGKVQVSASFNQGFTQATRLPELLGSPEIALLHNELIDRGNVTSTLHPAKYTDAEIQKFKDGSDPWRYPNTDWLGQVLRKWTPQNYTNVSLSGGSEKIRGLISVSTRFQDAVFKNSAGNYRQHDIRANLDMNPSKYILFSLDLNGRLDDLNSPTDRSSTIFHSLIGASPTRHAFWPNGLLGEVTHPLSGSSPAATSTNLAGYNKSKNYVFNSTAKLNIQVPFVPGLSFTGAATIDRNFAFSKYWSIPIFYNEWDGAVDANNVPILQQKLVGSDRSLSQGTNTADNYLINFLTNYEKKFGNHGVKLLFGVERMERKSDFVTISRRGFDANNLDQLSFGSTIGESISGASVGADRWQNYFGRVNYDYKSKYLAEFVWRYQASSKFSKNTRWGFFPGVSLGYRISEENFWKDNLSSINSFKIRGSIGKTGNDFVNSFQYLSLYNITGYTNYPFHYVSQIGANGALVHQTGLSEGVSPYDATWENAIQKNVGIDAELFNSRISITADYFNNYRTKILTPPNAAIPGSTGIVPADQNIGKFRNKGFDFNIIYRNNAGALSYQVGFNGLYAKNKLLFFDETPGIPEYQQKTGHPLGSNTFFQVIGIYQNAGDATKHPAYLNANEPGDLIFKDVNGDGVIDNLDLVRSNKTDVPTFSGGLNFDFEYRNVDLSILVQGATGAERYMRPTFDIDGNYLKSFYDNRWTPSNPSTTFPRIWSGSSPNWADPNAIFNSLFIKKTDYVRLKSLELGYTLPGTLLQRAGIQKLRFYVSGLNLLTYCPGLKDFGADPELAIADQFYGESYPIQRVLNVGVSVNF